MPKTYIGPKLRQLRRERGQTQAEMAKILGVSASYINLLENNQRSLSVQLLMGITSAYAVDWQDLTKDESAHLVTDLRNALQDPIFRTQAPDLQELRGAIDHAPVFSEKFLTLYQNHRSALEKILQMESLMGGDGLSETSPEAAIYDFFRSHSNYFDVLESAATEIGAGKIAPEDQFSALRDRLRDHHKIGVKIRGLGEMQGALRVFDEERQEVHLSQALDHVNQIFQLAHVTALIECADTLSDLVDQSGIAAPAGRERLQVELANYYAAAYLMPYTRFLKAAQDTRYNVDHLAANFGVSFEQVGHRLTTLQRKGAAGVPFFLLRIDKAGNITKRFNATSFNLAEHGGSCPVWNIHTAFRTPDTIVPQFVELPDGERFFTISRTVNRPMLEGQQQNDHRLVIALGCAFKQVDQIGYASSFNLSDPKLFSPIGINCHLCPRQACSQRAHQSLFVELPIDKNRRGNTRYES